MNKFAQILILPIFLLTVHSCSENKQIKESKLKKEIKLDNRYDKIENLISIALCKSPFGEYVTEVHSTNDDYTYFSQDFGKGQIIEILLKDGQGFLLDSLGKTKEVLSSPNIEMVRSHELHKMHYSPNDFFKNLTYDEDVRYMNMTHQVFKGNDTHDQPANFYYNPKEELITKINLTNPLDTSQIIQFNYLNWQQTKFGKMASDVEIIIAEKDTFSFDFENVIINSDDFRKKNIEN